MYNLLIKFGDNLLRFKLERSATFSSEAGGPAKPIQAGDRWQIGHITIEIESDASTPNPVEVTPHPIEISPPDSTTRDAMRIIPVDITPSDTANQAVVTASTGFTASQNPPPSERNQEIIAKTMIAPNETSDMPAPSTAPAILVTEQPPVQPLSTPTHQAASTPIDIPPIIAAAIIEAPPAVQPVQKPPVALVEPAAVIPAPMAGPIEKAAEPATPILEPSAQPIAIAAAATPLAKDISQPLGSEDVTPIAPQHLKASASEILDTGSASSASGIQKTQIVDALTLPKLIITLENVTFEHVLFKDATRIGRDQTNDLCLPDTSVSRYHTSIFKDSQGAWIIKDLNSTNGTIVNDVQIEQNNLTSGDDIELGNYKIKFVWPGEKSGGDLEPPTENYTPIQQQQKDAPQPKRAAAPPPPGLPETGGPGMPIRPKPPIRPPVAAAPPRKQPASPAQKKPTGGGFLSRLFGKSK